MMEVVALGLIPGPQCLLLTVPLPRWGLQQLWLWFSSRFARVPSLLAGLALQRCPCSLPCHTQQRAQLVQNQGWEPLEDLPCALC